MGKVNLPETESQMERLIKLIDQHPGIHTETIDILTRWMDGENVYPYSNDWTSKTRRQQADDFINWINSRINEGHIK